MNVGRIIFDHVDRKVRREPQDVMPLHTVLVDLRAERDRYRELLMWAVHWIKLSGEVPVPHEIDDYEAWRRIIEATTPEGKEQT